MYKKAVFGNVRWSTRRGVLSIEDLCFLPVEELDGLYKDLMKTKRAQSEDSLLEKATGESKVLDLKITIVKDIVETRLAETKERENVALKSTRRQKLLAALADKQADSLREMSAEELQAEIDELS